MNKPNLNKIIADNLEKDKFQSKSNPILPTDGWLNQYKRGGGIFPEYHSFAPPRMDVGGPGPGDGKTLPPIYTSNPNDPRLVNYKDSLTAYNAGQDMYNFGKGIYDEVRAPYNSEFRKNYSIERGNTTGLPYKGSNITMYPIDYYNEYYNRKPGSWYERNISDNRPNYFLGKNGEHWEPTGTMWKRFKKPVQPYILQDPKPNKTIPLKPFTGIIEKPEPKLKKKVSNVNKISVDHSTSLPGVTSIQNPNIEIPNIPTGKYKVSYWDPEMKDWTERSFMTKEESDKFFNEVPTYYQATQRVQYANGGDISIPDLDSDKWLTKYDKGGKTKKQNSLAKVVNVGKTFNEQWMNSPMYKKMLAQSTNLGPMIFNDLSTDSVINNARKNELKNVTWKEIPVDLNSPNAAAFSQSYGEWHPPMGGHPTTSDSSGNYQPVVKFVKEVGGKNGNDLNSNSVHEFSHASDKGGYLIPEKDLALINKYKSTSYLKSPLYKQHLNQGWENLTDKNWINDENNWLNYVNNPTETRARLNDFRMRAKEQKLYDPFTQQFKLDYLKNYKPLNGGWDPIEQLRGSYSDDEISDMLNKISKTDNAQPQTMAEYGGITKYGPGGAITDGCPPGWNKGPFGCVPSGFSMPVNKTDVPLSIQEKQRQDAAALEMQRRNEATAKRQFIGTPHFQTLDEQIINKQKKKQFVQTHPNTEINNQDEIVSKNPDRGFEGQPLTPNAKRFDKGLSHIMNAIEATSTLTGAGQIGSNLLRLGASSLEKGIGRNLISKGLKNFTSRINPTLNAIDEAGAYVQLDPIGIIGNKLNSKLYNPTTALNTANNTITGVEKNLINSAIEGTDLIAGENNLSNIIETAKKNNPNFTERNARVIEAWFNAKKRKAGIPPTAAEYMEYLKKNPPLRKYTKLTPPDDVTRLKILAEFGKPQERAYFQFGDEEHKYTDYFPNIEESRDYFDRTGFNIFDLSHIDKYKPAYTDFGVNLSGFGSDRVFKNDAFTNFTAADAWRNKGLSPNKYGGEINWLNKYK